MTKHSIYAVAIFCGLLGGGFAYNHATTKATPPQKIAVASPTLPVLTISGADAKYSVGDIITLSVTPYTPPANLLSVKYNWHVIDPNKENKNTVVSDDGATINFGTGPKSTTIKVILLASYLFNQPSIETSGFICKSIAINLDLSETNQAAAQIFRDKSIDIRQNNDNPTEIFRSIATLKASANTPKDRWEVILKNVTNDMLSRYTRNKLMTKHDYANFCTETADGLEGGK